MPMMPNDPIVGGNVLRRPAIQSPNFVHGVSGWSINADGSAEFHSITVPPGSGGNTVFFQGTTPTANAINDLWFNTANGQQVEQWNGAAWVPYTFGTGALGAGSVTAAIIAANTIVAANIAANTITAGQLAAGIIYAGIVNGTTITGAQIVDTGGGYFGYNGTPAMGNLFYSDTVAAGFDVPGNAYLAGITFYGNPSAGVWIAVNLGVTNAAFGPVYYTATSSAGPWSVDSWLRRSSGVAGQLEVGPMLKMIKTALLPPTPADGATIFVPTNTNTPRVLKQDGEPGYGFGETIYSTNSDIIISAAWAVPIVAGTVTLATPVVSGLPYFFEATFWANLSASFQIDLGFTGPTVANTQWFFQGHTSPTIIPLTTLTFVAPTPPAAGDYLARAWGSFTPSANGTFSMAAGKVANNFTIKAGTYLRVRTHH